MKKQMHVGILIYGVGHHLAAWKMPDSQIERLGDISYYQQLAKTCEEGKFDTIFFADNQALNATHDQVMPAMWLDPIVNLSAISQVTEHIGLVCTISGTFMNPYLSARQMLSLQHISKGRAGWNLVTSMTDEEAMNHSMNNLPNHADRYKKAREFGQLMNQLFTSWSEDDFICDKQNQQIIDHKNIRPINHEGEHFNVRGPLSTPNSKYGKPVAMQAGASDQGLKLAAEQADAVYSVSWNKKQAKRYRDRLDDAITSVNRTRPIKVFPGLVTYVGHTIEEAYDKKQQLDDLLDIESSLKMLEFFIQQDTSQWNLDDKVPELPPVEEFTGPKGRYETVLEIIKDKDPTVKELLGYLAAGGGHLTLIGTPKTIVDEMEQWLNEGIADGFNLMPPTLPNSLDDFVEMIIPELQSRGLFREDYDTKTLREHFGI
ncbi:LLM class flavin-dependent oxidoreductase [Abyssicoccus albus]|uniref:LLM class flavin-dependent oxidoreductase n=1 Tax=Abyssicoccus albus TaxID=1817405 RepID=UPI00097E185D|nr:LLM class flavin-dependent oxidoreductase [Abyssicoccus albus]AQL55613.1 monooxygenase [Abyssicoccus albus]